MKATKLLLTIMILTSTYVFLFGLTVSKDTTLSTYYSKNEIDQFKKLVKYFDQTITRNYPSNSGNLSESYKLFFKDLDTFRNVGEMYNQIFAQFDQSKIFKYLDKNLVDKIWHPDNRTASDGHQETGIALRHKSAYMSFLSHRSFLDQYCKSIEVAGGISPASLSLFITSEKKLNLNSLSDRLIITIHYLSISEPLVVKEHH